jgi:hypothetical protein
VAHGAFFVNPPVTAGQDVEFVFPGQQADLDLIPNLLPGLGQEGLFELGQFPLGGPDQIIDRPATGAHGLQGFFRGNAAIHHPDAIRLPILGLDGFKKVGQSGFIAGVAGQHFIGQRETLRGHNEGQDDLNAIRSFIPAVSVSAFSNSGRIGLEVGAGQVVKQDIEAGLLAVVDLAEIKDMTLDNLIIHCAMIFNDTPVAVFFPVFEPPFDSKKHAPLCCWGVS